MYKQYCSFYDLSDKKSADSFPFHLESHAKIWYNTIPDSQKANFDNLITLFKKRFKDKQHLLDLTILQTHQGRNESVLDYLSRLCQLATNRNISDDILLAVAMNGLKPELKTIVMTKELKNVEELRHCATLAEKAISSNTVNTISHTVLEEIQTLKDQLKSINIVQDVPPQTDNSYQNQQNQFYQPPQSMPYYVPQRTYYAPQRSQNRIQQNRFQRPRLIQNYSNSQIHRPPQGNQIRNDINLLITNSNVFIVELIVSLNLNVQLEMLFAICAIKLAIFQGFVNRQEGFRHNRGTRQFDISSRTGTQK